jgi:hypothetical protein
MNWTLDQIVAKLKEIKAKGFISIPPEMYRRDEGVIGQILEREFNITENNLSIRDLGDFELKGTRTKSNTLTLCHKTTEVGLTPIQIFDRFGYVKPSKRDKLVLKKKLFTTITGTRQNSLGFILKSPDPSSINMYYGKEFICGWNLEDSIEKIDQIILVIAETWGKTLARDEQFHFIEAYLLDELKNMDELVESGVIVIDFCIDQPIGSTRGPHDRGPHIRISKSKLFKGYRDVRKIL